MAWPICQNCFRCWTGNQPLHEPLMIQFTDAYITRPHFYQTRSAWSVDQGSNKNHSPAYNFAPTVTKFCVMWEGLSLPHDTKFGNCRCKIVDSRSFPSWSLIHGLRWSGLIKVGPGFKKLTLNVRGPNYLGSTISISWLLMPRQRKEPGHQQPWYWLCKICKSWSYRRKDFNYLWHINVEAWHKM